MAATTQALSGCHLPSLSWLSPCKPLMAVVLQAFHGCCLASLSWLSRCEPFMAVVLHAFHGCRVASLSWLSSQKPFMAMVLKPFMATIFKPFVALPFASAGKGFLNYFFPSIVLIFLLSRNPLATLPQPRLRQKKSTRAHTKPWCREYGLNSAEKDFRIFAQMQPLLALGCQPFLCQKPFWLLPNDFFYPYYLYSRRSAAGSARTKVTRCHKRKCRCRSRSNILRHNLPKTLYSAQFLCL